MAATIQDVARVSSVSPSTVSRAFNHSALVNEETRQRIFAAAKVLNYVPNASARSLSIGRTKVIGVLLPLAHGEFFSVLIRGVDQAIVEAKRELLIAGTHNDLASAQSAFRRMNGWVDGFLVVTHNLDHDAFLEAAPDGTPTVFLHAPKPLPGHSSLQTDNLDSACMAVRHLIDEGHRRIAIVKGPETNGEAHERFRGYKKALRQADLPVHPELIYPGDFTREGGMEAARALLSTSNRPTALFAANDDSAIGVMFALTEQGCRIPEDMAVIGFDDIPSAKYQLPSLSTIHVPIIEMGRKAVETLVSAIDDPDGYEPEIFKFKGVLKARASTIGSRYVAETDPPFVALTGTR